MSGRIGPAAHRPFIVISGNTRVRAVGTQFDIDRKHSGIVVTVLEGRVAARPSASPDIADSLKYFGSPDAAGRRPFSLMGTF